jgi:hypothetical protein
MQSLNIGVRFLLSLVLSLTAGFARYPTHYRVSVAPRAVPFPAVFPLASAKQWQVLSLVQVPKPATPETADNGETDRSMFHSLRGQFENIVRLQVFTQRIARLRAY